ncbi:MAG: hypothetical protein ABL962_01750 [Fimbriimonadaceae bacterium]
MAADVQEPSPRNRWKDIVVCLVLLATCFSPCLGFFWYDQMLLIFLEPPTATMTVNGRPVSYSDGYILHGWGKGEVTATFPDGTEMRIVFHPKLGSDNSSSVRITQAGVIDYGDVPFETFRRSPNGIWQAIPAIQPPHVRAPR